MHLHAPRSSRRLPLQRPRCRLACRATDSSSGTFADASLASKASKALVSGLTGIVNAVIPAGAQASEIPADTDRPSITPQDVLKGVRHDFTDNCYLWTGDISSEIYARDCVFTDPTLSFQGLATFQRNLASLRPLVDRLLAETDVQLFSCELDEEADAVVAEWRMTGTFVFPWRPRLDIRGRTRFAYDAAAGGRVVRYDENWNVSAASALGQLLRPGPPKAA